MDYARRLISRRLIAFKARSLMPQLPSLERRASRRGWRPSIGERVKASMARRIPTAESLGARRHELKYSATAFGRHFRDRTWLIRAGCAAGALLLFAFLISSSHSPLGASNLFGGPGNARGATTISSPGSSGATQQTPTVAATPTAPSTPTTSSSRTRTHSSTGTARAHGSAATTATRHASSSPATTSHAVTTTPTHSSTSSATTTTTTPAATTTTSTTSTTTPAQSSVPGCSQTAIRCEGGLVYTFHGPALAAAPAIEVASYRALADDSTLAQIIHTLGSPMSVAALKAFIGGSSLLSQLVQSQPLDDSCAYYLAAHDRTTRAFQLCFNSAQNLVAKAIISTSGSSSSS